MILIHSRLALTTTGVCLVVTMRLKTFLEANNLRLTIFLLLRRERRSTRRRTRTNLSLLVVKARNSSSILHLLFPIITLTRINTIVFRTLRLTIPSLTQSSIRRCTSMDRLEPILFLIRGVNNLGRTLAVFSLRTTPIRPVCISRDMMIIRNPIISLRILV